MPHKSRREGRQASARRRRRSRAAHTHPAVVSIIAFARPVMPATADAVAGFLGLGTGWGEAWTRVGGEIPSCSARFVRGAAPGFDTVDEADLVALESGSAAA